MQHEVTTSSATIRYGLTKCALAMSAILLVGSSVAQDKGVPFHVQQIDDQVINGVKIQGGYVPVWSDSNGKAGGRGASIPSNIETGDQQELDGLARIGQRSSGGTISRKLAAPITARTATSPSSPIPDVDISAPVRTASVPAFSHQVAATSPRYDVVDSDDLPPPSRTPSATLTRKQTPRTDEEELADLKAKIASAQDKLNRKQEEIETKKREAERRAQEAKAAAEREAARQKLVFSASEGQLLSEAITAYVGQNGWQNVEWNVGPDFRIKYAYSERPRNDEGMKEVLKRVLSPYNLSAELHRPNSVVEIFETADKAQR